MLVCASCGSRQSTYGLCPSCNEAYCAKCVKDPNHSCPQCLRETFALRVEPAAIPNMELDWLAIAGGGEARVGVVGLPRIPRDIFLPELQKAPAPLAQFVICENADGVERASLAYARYAGLPIPSDM